MKKIRILSVVLFVAATAVFTMFKVYERVNRDQTPPVITFDNEELKTSVTSAESDLLADVKAEDKKDGDVSDSLVVESLSGFNGDGTRTITYAAIDSQGNVARASRMLVYDDYQKPRFTLSGPLRFQTGKSMNVLEHVGAQSALDGDLTGNVKYSLENTVNVMNTGVYPVEFRVMDSSGNTVYLTTELEVYDMAEERIKVTLTDYLVYLDVNAGFDPMSYYSGASEEGELEVQSNVDTANAGIYTVDYIVHGANTIGKSRLIVVVGQ